MSDVDMTAIVNALRQIAQELAQIKNAVQQIAGKS